MGSGPVVAHPPCQLWGNLAAVNYKRWGGEHNRPGNDGGCFAAAVTAVRVCGGVLEHPAFTRAWGAYGLQRPIGEGWRHTHDHCNGMGEWVCEVWQSAYGHLARKRTWLLYVGLSPPGELDWAREPGTHHIGNYGGRAAKKPTVSRKQAIHTPPAFRDVLLTLAAGSRKKQLSA